MLGDQLLLLLVVVKSGARGRRTTKIVGLDKTRKSVEIRGRLVWGFGVWDGRNNEGLTVRARVRKRLTKDTTARGIVKTRSTL